MSESPSHTAAPVPHYAQSEAKRRRLRKGTHSCWECKRRKMKCVFDDQYTDDSDATNHTTVCNGCRRRGSKCVSQEFPEHSSPLAQSPSLSTHRGNHKGFVYHQARTPIPLENTTTTPSEEVPNSGPDYGIPTPAHSTISETDPSRYLNFYESTKTLEESRAIENGIPQSQTTNTHKPPSQGRHERLSRFLHESLPSRQDTESLLSQLDHHPSVLSHEIMTISYTDLDQNGLETPESLLNIPAANLHPVLIARHMLLLATFLQHRQPSLHREVSSLSEPPRAIMERLADLATSLVTTNDQLLGSIEGLECVMIESVYQANLGNLRRSWVANRRAMNIAQLMRLNRPDTNQPQCWKVLDPKTRYDPRLMWFRIIFLDRYLCLMLGVSQGSLDHSMASDTMLATDTPMGRLERIHCVVASRILERNEASPSSKDLTLTQSLDRELQRAARSLPSKWWLVPKLSVASAKTDAQALFWNTRRLFAQVLHYNLLNQLHLPYMLHQSSTKAERASESYSRIACANASREVLSRFITLRSCSDGAYRCRTVDFLALMAAMTLLLAHLNSHRSEAENLLAHQYYSDRAMIEQVQENMEEVNRVSSDALSAKSADLLRRLLAINVEMADGTDSPHGGSTKKVTVQEGGAEMVPRSEHQPDDAVVSVWIPYFGIIKISRNGMSKEANNRPQSIVGAEAQTQSTAQSGLMSELSTIANSAAPPNAANSSCPEPLPLDMSTGPSSDALHFEPQTAHLGFPDSILHQDGDCYPELAAAGEDWAFQGVDLAFFDSLTRSSTGNEGG